MRKIVFCLMVLIAFTTAPALGGGGHDHGSNSDHGPAVKLSQTQIIEKASGYVAGLVEKGKLDAFWAQVKPQEAKDNSAYEWVVTFSNPEIEDPEQKTLYMFLTLSGKYIAANFTGK